MKSFNKIINSLRNVRGQLGKSSRSLESELKNQTNISEREGIIKAYGESIKKLNEINCEY